MEGYREAFWKRSDYVRKNLKKVLTGCLISKEAFFSGFLKNISNPVSHDINKLVETHKALFSKDLQRYECLVFPKDAYQFEDLLGADLMEKVITSSSDRPFAVFVSKLEALSWVKTGVDHFAYHEKNTEGKCPFCINYLINAFC